MNTSTLRPGLLVSLKTALSGNVAYNVRNLVHDVMGADVGQVVKWETTRTIADVAEYEAAKKVRSKARSLVAGVCASSAFGLLCPETSAGELGQAISDAQLLADDFNRTSRVTRIGCFVIVGRVASDDVQAIRAINSEMADLIKTMQEGAANLDPAAIREAANKARDVAVMLTPATQERVAAAIDIARKEARRIVKAGETAATQVDASVVAALAHSRTAFLDFETSTYVAAPVVQATGVDFAEEAADSVAMGVNVVSDLPFGGWIKPALEIEPVQSAPVDVATSAFGPAVDYFDNDYDKGDDNDGQE